MFLEPFNKYWLNITPLFGRHLCGTHRYKITIQQTYSEFDITILKSMGVCILLFFVSSIQNKASSSSKGELMVFMVWWFCHANKD